MNKNLGPQPFEGAVPPNVAEKLHQQLANKEVFSAQHLMDKCLHPLTGQPLIADDLKPGQVVFLMNAAGEVSAVFKLVGLHPSEPAEKNMWVMEKISISHAYHLDRIKKVRQAIIDRAFEDLQEGDENWLGRLEAGQKVRLPLRLQGAVALIFQNERLDPMERDQMIDLLFESGD